MVRGPDSPIYLKNMKLILEITEFDGHSAPHWNMQIHPRPRQSDGPFEIISQDCTTSITERVARLDWLAHKLAPVIATLVGQIPRGLDYLTEELKSLPPIDSH